MNRRPPVGVQVREERSRTNPSTKGTTAGSGGWGRYEEDEVGAEVDSTTTDATEGGPAAGTAAGGGEPAATAAPGGRGESSPLRKVLYALGVLAALAALWWLGRLGGGYVPAFAAWVDGLGLWGPLVFIAGYAVATVALVPGSILTLAAGAIFGLAEGTLYVFAGASLGACGAFLVSRYLARGAVERRLARHPRFAAVDRAVGREGRKIVFLLRLSPVFPFNLLNYGLGLTRVRFVDYAVACLGMLPGTFLYVYYGKLLGDVAAVAGGAEVERGAGYWVVLGLGIAATVAVTALITAKARQALQRETDLDLEGGARG